MHSSYGVQLLVHADAFIALAQHECNIIERHPFCADILECRTSLLRVSMLHLHMPACYRGENDDYSAGPRPKRHSSCASNRWKPGFGVIQRRSMHVAIASLRDIRLRRIKQTSMMVALRDRPAWQ